LSQEVYIKVSKLISIVIPVYFEEEIVEDCYKRLTSVARENNLNYEFFLLMTAVITIF
jgi:dolichol-phosphate mannosyltransferase